MSHSSTPIKDINFSGLHWIEASAGSGKTYTLSSLMVRVLLESYLPSQVVATTFTRAATAELKERIRTRLIEVYRFLDSRRECLESENLAYANELDEQDELLAKILRHFASTVSYGCERSKIVLEQLDHLFVGTLDSFSQKLLREFAFESGKIDRAEITDNARRYTNQIIHDSLREWINSQDQSLIDMLFNAGAIAGAEAYTRLVEESLNFVSAEFKEPEKNNINTEEYTNFKRRLIGLDISKYADMYLPDGEGLRELNGQIYRSKTKFTEIFTRIIPNLLNGISSENLDYVLSKSFGDDLDDLLRLRKNFYSDKIMKRGAAVRAFDEFSSDEKVLCLFDFLDCVQMIRFEITKLEVQLKHYLCCQVRKKLPDLLASKGETTFSQQITSICDALNGPNGQNFAEAVQQKYPLIIVDEFQDTNQEQDNILAAIWRHKDRYSKGCIIMVGDRKQAIYGFRGGDMLTFVNAYADVQLKQGSFYHLLNNHRTIPELVDAIDHLFQLRPDFGEQVAYYPVTAGKRKHPPLVENGVENPYPLRWLSINKSINSHVQMAHQVVNLLNQGSAGELCVSVDGQQIAICEDDIAVLARSNDDLDKIQYELERMGVSVNRPSKRSVFEGILAHDVAAILAAILNPNNENMVRRALISSLVGLTQAELSRIENSPDGLANYVAEFRAAHDLWLQRGFLTAWQFILDTFNVWITLTPGKGKESERNIVNLRHIAELLSQFSWQLQGPQSLYQWYLKQITKPSERDWELERSLTSDSGVQLMTIHRSKGLEFKIVMLFKADGGINDRKKKLNYSSKVCTDPNTNQKVEKRVIGLHGDIFNDIELSQHQLRLQSENCRQWYVALTRASHRVYVFMHDEKKGLSGVGYWKNYGEYIHPQSLQIEPLTNSPRYIPPQNMRVEITAMDMPNVKFYPKTYTSFSALNQYLSASEAEDFMAQEYHDDSKLDEYTYDVYEQKSPSSPIPHINKNFATGPSAGTYLHDVLDVIDFTDSITWKYDIYRRLKNGHIGVFNEMVARYTSMYSNTMTEDQITDKLWIDLADWFKAITSTQFQPGLSLRDLEKSQYLSEVPFVISMSDRIFIASKITAELKKYGIVMPEPNRAESARYLTGSIDLIYQFNNKFYIADYKSNYLGSSYTDYTSEKISLDMMQSSYHLQAVIYLVSLHRYLKKRIQGYDPKVHLGGATYLYLRGMCPNQNTGFLNWEPDIGLILKIDSMLGQKHQHNTMGDSCIDCSTFY